MVATANRRESACKRTGEPSVPFCEKMRQDKKLKNYSAARRNILPQNPKGFAEWRRNSEASDRFFMKKTEQAKLVPTWSGRQDSNLLEILVFQCLLRFDNYLTTRLVLVRYHYFN